LPLNKQSAMGWANAAGTNIDRVAKVESIKYDVAPELMRVGIGLGIPGIQRETKKTFQIEM